MLKRIFIIVLFTFIIQGCKVTKLTTVQSPELVTKSVVKEDNIEVITSIPADIAPQTTTIEKSKKTTTSKSAKISRSKKLNVSKGTKNQTHLEKLTGTVIVSTTISTLGLPPIHSITFQQVDANEKNKKYTLLNNIQNASDSTSLFFGDLPHGKYKISGISEHISGKSTALTVSDLNTIGYFVITTNTPTDLGRLIVSKTHSNNEITLGRSKLITNNNALVTHYFKHDSLTTSSGWLTPHHNNDIVEQLALSHSQGISNLVETNQGEIIASTQLGTILIRSQDSTWKVLSNNVNKITSIYPYNTNNNVAIVADELGALYSIKKDGKKHTIDKGNLPEGIIVFIASSNNHNAWFIALERNGHSELYQSNALLSNNWQLTKQTELDTSLWREDRKVLYWHRSNGIGFIAPKVKSINCFNYTSKQWVNNPLPNNRFATAVSTSLVNDSIGILTSSNRGLSGLFAKTSLSHDCGQTWTSTNSPYSINVSAPLFINDNFILESNSKFSSGGLYVSRDGNQSWHKVEGNNFFTNTLWVTKYNGIFSISTTEHGIETLENTTDFGITWHVEETKIVSPSINIAAP